MNKSEHINAKRGLKAIKIAAFFRTTKKNTMIVKIKATKLLKMKQYK
jgi:hypothetical protein